MIKGWGHLRFWRLAFNQLQGKIARTSNPDKILPKAAHWFRALELTPFKEVRCVIVGQEPYVTKGYANGLAFSVYPHVRPLPRSLRNIFTEYEQDLGYPTPRNGELDGWAKNGVLLLNSILTVEEGKPLSHAGLGWEKLTYEILRSLDERGNCVFILWGKEAQAYRASVRSNETIVGPHPSPLSANTGFFGSRPFSRVNEFLREQGQPEVNWRLK